VALTVTKAGALAPADFHAKFLLFGKSGAGKTRLGATAPNPIVLLTEANGLATLRRANPDAGVIEAYAPTKYGLSTSYEVVAQFMVAAHAGEFAAAGYRTVVVDSGTEVQRILRDQILREKGQLQNAGYQFTQQDWGMLTERMRRFARSVRDLPYHVVFLALSQEKQDEDGVEHVAPSFEGQKLPNEIAQFFSAVGYVYKKRAKVIVEGQAEQEVTRHAVLFQGASKYLVKPCDPLADVEGCDVSNWIERITAEPTTTPTTAHATVTQNNANASSEKAPVAVTTEQTSTAPAANVETQTDATASATTTTRRRTRGV
jgi:hypothetical protein